MTSISVAPEGTPIGSPDFVDVSESISDVDISMGKLADAMGTTANEVKKLIAVWSAVGIHFNPKAELLWRLNESVKGRDPGKPRLWKGL